MELRESTAADRAAADVRRGGRVCGRAKGLCESPFRKPSLPAYKLVSYPQASILVAAALSAAVTTTKSVGDAAPTLRGLRRSTGNAQAYSQLLFGREREGGASLRESRLPRTVPRTFPIPSYSSGEGVWGRGASLREAASPPEFHFPIAPLREGVRGRTLLYREAFSPAIVPLSTLNSLLRR